MVGSIGTVLSNEQIFSERERHTYTHSHTHIYTDQEREREILRSSLRRRRDCKTKTAGRKAGCASAGAP